jgi:hypothetical protein
MKNGNGIKYDGRYIPEIAAISGGNALQDFRNFRWVGPGQATFLRLIYLLYTYVKVR